ncbi:MULTISPECIES: type IV pilus modification protein PilV [Shewanella]|uniref:type IV pilus modification protein PilV n=1 Tax=Shewanella TaxID=22 RepID=UPI001EFC5D04|nr:MULTISPECIES: type IV pilus modification protein PilV [Shewanella]MCG9745611.1 type IV pilus modification protein PilV [Shewanella sp. Isolate8]MCL2910384.1 type IV pilus modification protein PilV [Shewanella aquimarina]
MVKGGKGFSLIEVMVSLVILVIGLIGIFNLHVVSKRGSFESFQQTQASYYANDIINRMKLNPTQLANYAGTYSGAPSSVSKQCQGATICSSSEMVAWDLYEWQTLFNGTAEQVGTQNVGGLDTPTACIVINGNSVLVTMAWKGIRETSIASATSDCGSTTANRRLYSVQTVI